MYRSGVLVPFCPICWAGQQYHGRETHTPIATTTLSPYDRLPADVRLGAGWLPFLHLRA